MQGLRYQTKAGGGRAKGPAAFPAEFQKRHCTRETYREGKRRWKKGEIVPLPCPATELKGPRPPWRDSPALDAVAEIAQREREGW